MKWFSMLILFLLFAAAPGTPVVWDRTYDFGGSGTEFYCVQETTDGDFIVAGKIAYFSDARVLLFDSDGNHLWSSEYGVSGRTYWVEEVPSGGYIATGISYPSSGGEVNVLILRTDASGDTLWSRSYGWFEEENRGNCIKNYPDGGYVICGTSSLDNLVDRKMWILRTAQNGDTLWTKNLVEGGCDETFGQSLVIDFDGNIVAGGYGIINTDFGPQEYFDTYFHRNTPHPC